MGKQKNIKYIDFLPEKWYNIQKWKKANSYSLKQGVPVHSINMQKAHKELKKQNVLLEI